MWNRNYSKDDHRLPLGLPVKGYNSGPLGGDQQIGVKIVEGTDRFCDLFSDPLTAQPHDPDVKAHCGLLKYMIFPLQITKQAQILC